MPEPGPFDPVPVRFWRDPMVRLSLMEERAQSAIASKARQTFIQVAYDVEPVLEVATDMPPLQLLPPTSLLLGPDGKPIGGTDNG